jgi:NADH:ubiquinone oxidoreductase subunit 2 (subunit N)
MDFEIGTGKIPPAALIFALAIIIAVVDAIRKKKESNQQLSKFIAIVGLCLIIAHTTFTLDLKENFSIRELFAFINIVFCFIGILIMLCKEKLINFYEKHNKNYSLFLFAIFGIILIINLTLLLLILLIANFN